METSKPLLIYIARSFTRWDYSSMGYTGSETREGIDIEKCGNPGFISIMVY